MSVRDQGSPDRVSLLVGLAQDRGFATITLQGERQSLFINLTPVDLDEVIAKLGQIRASMSDPVPVERDPNLVLDVVYDPAWRIGTERIQGQRLLTFRHPGLGWQNFLVPDHEAKAIAEFLTQELP